MDAVVGRAFTFSVLFVNEMNMPMAVADPTISLFSFSQGGLKNLLVDAAPMTPVVPAEVGRYVYTWTVPGVFNHGDIVFVEMMATDPVMPGTRLLVEETVNLITLTGGGSSGLVARFVKGG